MWLWWVACSPEPAHVRVEAWRGAPGYWPENSATALEGVVRAGLDAVSLDVAVAADAAPVVFRGTALPPHRCAFADGSAIADAVVLADLELDDLVRDYRCGGLPQAEFPNAIVAAEPVLSLAGAVGILRDAHPLDVRLLVETTEAADAALAVWADLDPPNALTLSSASRDVLAEAEGAAELLGLDVDTALLGPKPGAADDAGLDGVVLPAPDRAVARDARKRGLSVYVIAEGLVEGADVVSTPYPGDLAVSD